MNTVTSGRMNIPGSFSPGSRPTPFFLCTPLLPRLT
jgi:hypothetical protein